ncbi:hypothetical protein Q9189_002670 [Teloschistes chrysophthalmus]
MPFPPTHILPDALLVLKLDIKNLTITEIVHDTSTRHLSRNHSLRDPNLHRLSAWSGGPEADKLADLGRGDGKRGKGKG